MGIVGSLTLVGRPRPIARDALVASLGDACVEVPLEYLDLLTCYGAGALWGYLDLLDPTDSAGRFAALQDRWHVFGARWLAKDSYKLLEHGRPSGVVLGLERGCRYTRGRRTQIAALIARGGQSFALDHGGDVAELGNLEAMTNLMIERYAVEGLHAIYATEQVSYEDVIEALARGDEVSADAAIGRLVDEGLALEILLDLFELLATGTPPSLPPAMRASYVDQLFRMAKRRAPEIASRIAIKQLVDQLASGSELGADRRREISSLFLPTPSDILHMPLDDIEVALVTEIAPFADAPDARLVLGDRLEHRGWVDLAAHVRAAPPPKPTRQPVVDDPEVSNDDFPNLHGPEQLALAIARWRSADPSTSIEELVTRAGSLSVESQQRLMLHVARASFQYPDRRDETSRTRLIAELATAWPILILGLRWSALSVVGVLEAANAKDAAPYLLSVILHPHDTRSIDQEVALAEAYSAFCKITPALVDELLRFFEPGAEPPVGADLARMQQVAFCMLRGSVDDERVFELYLREFARAHPSSEHALFRRRDDPRVEESILAALEREEAAVFDGNRFVRPTGRYELYATFLAKLGSHRGEEAVARLRSRARYLSRLEDGR